MASASTPTADGPASRWPNPFTSTLVGAALRDGFIRSMDDKVSTYIPEMKGSAYDDVSVQQLLTMTSGVRWNEDYADPNSDVARFNNHQPEPGVDALVSYMRRLPRDAPAGTRWHYSTGETNLVGILVSRAVGKPLAQYLQEKIWQPAGMERPATWLLSKSGQEISGCCLQAAPRDFARFEQFILEGARVEVRRRAGGLAARPPANRPTSASPGAVTATSGGPTTTAASARAGIFGQGIFIDPKRQLVIVTNADWGGGARDPRPCRRARPFTGPCRRPWRKSEHPLSRSRAFPSPAGGGTPLVAGRPRPRRSLIGLLRGF